MAQRGLFSNLEDLMTSPLFLGGAALVSGEGMGGAMRGMQTGAGFQEMRRERALRDQQAAGAQQFLADGRNLEGLPPALANYVRSQGPQGAATAVEFLAKNFQTPAQKSMADAELAYKRAQTERLRADAASGGETPANVREWQHFQRLSPEQQQQYLTMKRSSQYLDLGDRFVQPNPMQPGANVAERNKNIVEAERQKVEGKTVGEGQAALPKAENALREYEIKSMNVLADIDRALTQASPWTTGFVGNLGSYIAGTPQHDLSKTLVGIQSNLGFETLQQMRDNSPTGGALGSITEREIELLQSTWGSLAQSQSEPQFKANLARLKQIKQEFAILKREAYQRDVARFGAGAVPNPDGGGGSPPPAASPSGFRYLGPAQ